MRTNKLEKDIRCPFEYCLDIFTGRWKARILSFLKNRESCRFIELRDGLHSVSDAALSTALKELQASGILERVQYNEIPPRVEYYLSDKGKAILPLFEEICAWGRKYCDADNAPAMLQCQHCVHNRKECEHDTPSGICERTF